MAVLGVDPGKYGGLAILSKGADEVIDIPIVGDKVKARVNVPELVRWLKDNPVDHAFIERAQAMPKQGASSGFLYGRCVGALEATVQALGIPMTIVEAFRLEETLQAQRRAGEQGRVAAPGAPALPAPERVAGPRDGPRPCGSAADRALRLRDDCRACERDGHASTVGWTIGCRQISL
jgi:uncharacterized protein YbjT (DUF2867 family)